VPLRRHLPPRVELLHFPGCPHVQAARMQLSRAMTSVGLPPQWVEHDVTAPHAPLHTQGYGSPTILIDGRDVCGATPVAGAACRWYPGSETPGAPPVEAIVAGLGTPPPRRGVLAGCVAALPGLLVSALPVVACPSCWPVYGAALGALGVPFLMAREQLLPITVIALLLALVGLGWRADRRRGFGPLAVGVFASACILAGKFAWDLPFMNYGGTILLLGAVIWNGWRLAEARPSCTDCSCPP
jgi:mercuric ion transport protein